MKYWGIFFLMTLFSLSAFSQETDDALELVANSEVSCLENNSDRPYSMSIVQDKDGNFKVKNFFLGNRKLKSFLVKQTIIDDIVRYESVAKDFSLSIFTDKRDFNYFSAVYQSKEGSSDELKVRLTCKTGKEFKN